MNAGRRKGLRVGVVALIAGLGLSQATLADPAQREMNFESVTRAIDISGLDLTTQAGAERLYRQIAVTAKKICWSTSKAHKGVTRAKQEHDYARRCFDEAVNGALAQVEKRTGVDLERVAGSDRFDHANLVAWR